MATPFLDRLKAGEVLVADGATGTNLQARGLAFGKAPEEWLFEQPDQIKQLHSDFIAAVFKKGEPSISPPVVGRMLSRPIIVMTVPIYGERRQIIGALSGIINLEHLNFLDQITGSRYGKSGGYVIVAPRAGLVVMVTKKELVMQPTPAPGQNPTVDQFNAGELQQFDRLLQLWRHHQGLALAEL